MTAAASATRNIAASTAKTSRRRCASCSTPWRPNPRRAFAFQGIPEALYLDNGPIAKSRVFHGVMEHLGVRVMTHMPTGKDGRRPTARSKGKVERAFRTVKEAHETLYHFHEPETEAEANFWLRRYLLHYNAQPHRSAGCSRSEDWLARLPEGGFRAMCAWERFCAFAREPERRKVGGDARITVEGVVYEVDPELAGETVVLWWGLFDRDLFVEHGERRFDPTDRAAGRSRSTTTASISGPRDERADRIAVLATKLAVPRGPYWPSRARSGHRRATRSLPSRPFVDPDPFRSSSIPRRSKPSAPSPTYWAHHWATRGRRARRDRRHPARDPRAQPRAGARPGPSPPAFGRRPARAR